MISMLPEKLDCLPSLPSSSRECVSEMPSSNSIWQLRRLNCLSTTLLPPAAEPAVEEEEEEEEVSSCQLPRKSLPSWGLSLSCTRSSPEPARPLQPNATYAELLPKRSVEEEAADVEEVSELEPKSELRPDVGTQPTPRNQGQSPVGVLGVVACDVSLCWVHAGLAPMGRFSSMGLLVPQPPSSKEELWGPTKG